MEKINRHHPTFRRIATLYDQDNKPLLTVELNVYFPDCFKWSILKEKGWNVFI